MSVVNIIISILVLINFILIYKSYKLNKSEKVKNSDKEDALEIVTRLDKINTEINKRFGEKII